MQIQSEGFLNTRELTVADRCDRCGAEAYIVATKGVMELLFCNHHGQKLKLTFMADGWRIQDDSYKLTGDSIPEPENV